MLKNKKILVSGGAGVIGKSLVDKLVTQGAIVLVGDLKPRPPSWDKNIIFRQGDLNYIKKEELHSFNPEYFFHLAATFERSEENYEFWDQNFNHNVNLSHHLMSCLKDCPALKKVIFASSYLIYDPINYCSKQKPQKSRRLVESDSIYPRNLCGAAKLFHELENRFLDSFNQTKFETISARIFRVYGKNSRDVISRWVRSLINNEVISVYNPENCFDYIYADEVAEGLIKLATSNATGIVNLGRDNARSVNEVLKILKQSFPNMKSQYSQSEPIYESSQANMDKFEELTGWKPTLELEDTIPELIEYENRKENKSEISEINILVTSISKKVPLIKSLKEANKKLGNTGKIFGADTNNDIVGKFFVDEFWKMPKLDDISLRQIIDFCKKNEISCIIPTRDGELEFFARNRQELKDKNIHVMISDAEAVNNCLDKLKFFEISKKMGFPVIQTTTEIDDLSCERFVVKEQFGAGSRNIGLGLTKEETSLHAKKLHNPVFQPFIEGKEYSIDLYVNKDGKTQGIVTRTRDLIVNGESQITQTLREPSLESICSKLVEKLGLYGHVVVQVLKDNHNEIHIIECNNRFGGASSLSEKVGLDSFYWFLIETIGEDLSQYPFYRSEIEKKQIRYPKDLVL